MSLGKKINPALIGAFVLVAAVLVVAAVFYFGANKYKGELIHNVAYFRSQTHGLEVGAPVVVQGVKVGNVTNIDVGYEDQAKSFYVRVEFVTSGESVLWPEQDRDKYNQHSPEFRKKMIELGFRARLASQSLVTGKLMIELGFFPNTQAQLYGSQENEIPTIASPAQKLWDELSQVDVRGISKSLESTVAGLERLVNGLDVDRIEDALVNDLSELGLLVADARKLLAHLDGRIDPMADGIDKASGNIATLAQDIGKQAVPLSAETRALVVALTSAAKSFDSAFASVNRLVAKDSQLQMELSRTLGNVSDAARSLRQFADYLERHPEALLTGKKR